jgi:kynurenine formamidase
MGEDFEERMNTTCMIQGHILTYALRPTRTAYLTPCQFIIYEQSSMRSTANNAVLPKTFIDLTHTLLESTVPVVPGSPLYSCCPTATISKVGFSIHSISFSSHTGTHIDAPSHFITDGKTVEQIPLSMLVGPALVIDLTRRSKPLRDRQMLVWSDIEPYAEHLREGVILLLFTGWSQYWGTPKYFEHPYLSRDAAERIVQTGVRVIGVDMMGPDETPLDGVGTLDGFQAHKAILGAGGVLAENLTNLQALANNGQHVVSLVPLTLAGSDGSPIRAFAWEV